MNIPSVILSIGRVLHVNAPTADIEKFTIDGEVPTKANIALIPDNPEEWALDGGDPTNAAYGMTEHPDAMHVTIKYLGDLPDTEERKRIELNINELASRYAPVQFTVTGSAMFGKNDDVLVLELESTTAHKLFRAVDAATPDVAVKWPSYKAHMALMYCKDESTKNMPVGKYGPASHLVGKTMTCSAITCQWAEDQVLVKLTGIEKGDFPGHPFRGNQWTGGGAVMYAADKGGGGGMPKQPKVKPRPVPPGMHLAEQSEIDAFNKRRKAINETRKAHNAKVGSKGSGKEKLLPIIQGVWQDVHISDHPDGKPSKYTEFGLLATGVSTDGKPKYIYSEEHQRLAADTKFGNVREMETLIPKLDKVLDKAVFEKDDPTTDALAIIRHMGFRVGGDGESLDRTTGKKVITFGATTLQRRHVKISANGKKVTFDFPGKGFHRQRHVSEDPTVIRAAQNGLARTTKSTDRLFPDTDDKKTIGRLREITGHTGLVNHNLRTRLATVRAQDWLDEQLESYEAPKTPDEQHTWRMEMAEHVSHIIGDTVAVTLSTYIAPHAYEEILGGK